MEILNLREREHTGLGISLLVRPTDGFSLKSILGTGSKERPRMVFHPYLTKTSSFLYRSASSVL
jgi:hypothetical protein